MDVQPCSECEYENCDAKIPVYANTYNSDTYVCMAQTGFQSAHVLLRGSAMICIYTLCEYYVNSLIAVFKKSQLQYYY